MSTPAISAQAGIQRVGLFGAPGTGRTRLAQELSARGVAAIELTPDAASRCDTALVMGLDLPSSTGHEAEDARIRAQLQAAGVVFQVVYGQGAQRLQSALLALGLGERSERDEGRAWNWVCEKCSDPACEHRLFTRLKEGR
ncbi:ATP-binding protein [Ramlibacter sp. USB13]|uniref:ATP-binding protein n=1 Tax=Ramlibacter cellulosilyticus TaxID=2764187 RepID=A0A923MNM2_9BURK|nr:ATP-binding protein [Ramlibacter cellulosilyticus]MBC5782408.1 ATP-binding protein [Ramlibacter cellulosilyticus]